MKSFIIGCVFVLCFVFSLEVYAGNNCEPNGKMNASGTCDCLKGFKNVGGVGKSRCEKEVVKASEDADKPDPIDKVKLDSDTVYKALDTRDQEFNQCLINDPYYKPGKSRVYIDFEIEIKNSIVTVRFVDNNYTSTNILDFNSSYFKNCINQVFQSTIFPAKSYYIGTLYKNIMTEDEFKKEKQRRVIAEDKEDEAEVVRRQREQEKNIAEEKYQQAIEQRKRYQEEDRRQMVEEQKTEPFRSYIGSVLSVLAPLENIIIKNPHYGYEQRLNDFYSKALLMHISAESISKNEWYVVGQDSVRRPR